MAFVNRRDLDFMLYEWLKVDRLCDTPRFAMHDRATFDAVLEVAHQIAQSHFAPHAALLDANEPTFDGHKVHIPPEVGRALQVYAEAGLMASTFDEADGGAQLPYTLGQAVAAMFHAANVSTSGYVMLTMAAANLLGAFGTPDQKARYMAPMLTGRFFGTMCLSEPQAGSSLGDIRTRATPTDGGLYKIVGDKMWISGGDHDMSQNIVHLVLARLPDAPPGVKGISLFIVPKRRVDPDGALGDLNGVRLTGLNHKMGYRGTVNTVLAFGDEGDCLGELIGPPHQGLACMFHMMNEARIGVGLGASMLGVAGFLVSLDYARSRPQGRPLGDKDPSRPQVMIIEHADVRRMLLAQKAWVEGGLGLCLTCAHLVDLQHTADDPERRQNLALLLDLLTPIAKAWPSEWCLEANKLAIQVLGGYGYTRDYPVERLYRDNRLNPIHEGTNGIQALDLLGRKVPMRDGAALRLLAAEILRASLDARRHPALTAHADALDGALDTASKATAVLTHAMRSDPERALANASVYLDMLGHILVAWIWLQQATAAADALNVLDDADHTLDGDRAFFTGKLRACRYFFRWELPKIGPWAALLSSLDDTCLTMPPECF